MISSGASFPSCSRRCQTHATISWRFAMSEENLDHCERKCSQALNAQQHYQRTVIRAVVERTRNLVAHGDAREGKWRGKMRMEWIASRLASTLHTPRLPVVDWTDPPRRLKWTRPFRRKTNSGFCACAVTFRVGSTYQQQRHHHHYQQRRGNVKNDNSTRYFSLRFTEVEFTL